MLILSYARTWNTLAVPTRHFVIFARLRCVLFTPFSLLICRILSRHTRFMLLSFHVKFHRVATTSIERGLLSFALQTRVSLTVNSVRIWSFHVECFAVLKRERARTQKDHFATNDRVTIHSIIENRRRTTTTKANGEYNGVRRRRSVNCGCWRRCRW